MLRKKRVPLSVRWILTRVERNDVPAGSRVPLKERLKRPPTAFGHAISNRKIVAYVVESKHKRRDDDSLSIREFVLKRTGFTRRSNRENCKMYPRRGNGIYFVFSRMKFQL